MNMNAGDEGADIMNVNQNKLHNEINILVNEDKFSGNILLLNDNTEIFKGSYGVANKSFDIPNNYNTRFNIASVGKMFTGVAVAQLAEQGELKFEDPISKFISDDWLPFGISQNIQIRHLLTHTSGLEEFFPALYAQPHNVTYLWLLKPSSVHLAWEELCNM